jgi:hypothetical protein
VQVFADFHHLLSAILPLAICYLLEVFMPRNPSKTRCAVPGCRNWSMHDHTRCRSHREAPPQRGNGDAEIGPHSVGAPGGNLNALKHGRYSNPLSEPELERLVVLATQQPDDLAYHIALLVRAIQDRIGDPSSEAEIPGIRSFRTLLVVNRALLKLIDRLASARRRAEIAEALSALPPGVQERVQAELEALTSRTTPVRALALL